MNGAQQLRKVDICGDTMNSSTIQLFPYISAGGRLFTDFSQTIQSNTCIFSDKILKFAHDKTTLASSCIWLLLFLATSRGWGWEDD